MVGVSGGWKSKKGCGEPGNKRRNFKAIEADKISIGDVKRREELMLIPRMGHA